MYCVRGSWIIEDTVKKSRFIGIVRPCGNESEILMHLKKLHIDYEGASHIAFAYRLKTEQGICYRFHDAGEPSGTAGKPIYQHLDGRNLVNVLAVVIRYFGGIKLGTGGLARAYGNAARRVIESADIEAYVERVMVRLTLDYSRVQQFDYVLNKLGGRLIEQDFAAQASFLIELPFSQFDPLLKSLPECSARLVARP